MIDDKGVELLRAMHEGRLKKQGRGRPKKGSTAVRWKDLGMTRQEVWLNGKLGEISEEDITAYMNECRAKGKVGTERGLLVRHGKINVITDDVLMDFFADTPLGELAEALLSEFEKCISELSDERQRRMLVRIMHCRMKQLCFRQDMKE